MSKSFAIELSNEADRAMRRLPRDLALRIGTVLERFAADPMGHHPQAKPLVGYPGLVRLRIGDWRVSLRVNANARVVHVLEVAARGSAYRW